MFHQSRYNDAVGLRKERHGESRFGLRAQTKKAHERARGTAALVVDFARIIPFCHEVALRFPRTRLSGVIEVAPLAFMRGRTFNDSFLILDEAQNTTLPQMKMFLTRMGMNSKFIITGDVTQIDLPRTQDSGLVQAIKLLKKTDGISFVELDETDIVRHRLVKEIVKAFDKMKIKNDK